MHPIPFLKDIPRQSSVQSLHDKIFEQVSLFFGHGEKRLSRFYLGGRTRLYCHSMNVTRLSPEELIRSPCSTPQEASHSTWTLGKGPWKRMYLSHQSCSFSWRVELRSNNSCMSSQGAIYHGFSGTTHAEYTLDTLLDGLADSSVVEGRQDQNRIVHLADTKSSYVLGSPESMSGTTVANPVFTDTSSIRYCTVLYCTVSCPLYKKNLIVLSQN